MLKLYCYFVCYWCFLCVIFFDCVVDELICFFFGVFDCCYVLLVVFGGVCDWL